MALALEPPLQQALLLLALLQQTAPAAGTSASVGAASDAGSETGASTGSGSIDDAAAETCESAGASSGMVSAMALSRTVYLLRGLHAPAFHGEAPCQIQSTLETDLRCSLPLRISTGDLSEKFLHIMQASHPLLQALCIAVMQQQGRAWCFVAEPILSTKLHFISSEGLSTAGEG